jgi:hypothetical protein
MSGFFMHLEDWQALEEKFIAAACLCSLSLSGNPSLAADRTDILLD